MSYLILSITTPDWSSFIFNEDYTVYAFVMRVFTVFKSTNLLLSILFFRNSGVLNCKDNIQVPQQYQP